MSSTLPAEMSPLSATLPHNAPKKAAPICPLGKMPTYARVREMACSPGREAPRQPPLHPAQMCRVMPTPSPGPPRPSSQARQQGWGGMWEVYLLWGSGLPWGPLSWAGRAHHLQMGCALPNTGTSNYPRC